MPVTGFIGNEEVNLNNAATEATLQQLVAAIGVLTAKTDNTFKTNQGKLQQFYKELDKAVAASKDFKESAENNSSAVNDNTGAVKDNTNASYQQAESQRRLRNTTNTLVRGFDGIINFLSDTSSSLAGMGNNLDAAANALGNIPVIGSRFSKILGPTAAAADRVYESFLNASVSGATFGGSINEMIDSASGAGLTLEDFTSILSETGPQLALLGEGTREGARRLGDLGRQMRQTGVSDQLARLGIGTAEQNKLIARQAELRARTGQREQMTDQQLIQQTQEYAKNLSAVSRLTGETRDSLEAQQEARMADAAFRQMLTEVDPNAAKNINTLLSTLPESMRQGAQDLFTRGAAAQSEEARRLMGVAPEVADALISQGSAARQSGTFTRTAMLDAADAIERGSRQFINTPLADTLGRFVPEFNNVYVGLADIAQRSISLRDALAQTQSDAETETGDGVTPERLKTLKENVAAISNNTTKFLANSEALDKMEETLNTFVTFHESVVRPAFDFVVENLYLLAGAALAASSALAVLGSKRFMDLLGNRRGGRGPRAGPSTGPATSGRSGSGTRSGLKNIGGKAVKGLKFVPGLGLVVTGATAALSAGSGAANAEDILGIEGREATGGERAKAGFANMIENLTFGLVSTERVLDRSGGIPQGAQNTDEFGGVGQSPMSPSMQSQSAKPDLDITDQRSYSGTGPLGQGPGGSMAPGGSSTYAPDLPANSESTGDKSRTAFMLEKGQLEERIKQREHSVRVLEQAGEVRLANQEKAELVSLQNKMVELFREMDRAGINLSSGPVRQSPDFGQPQTPTNPSSQIQQDNSAAESTNNANGEAQNEESAGKTDRTPAVVGQETGQVDTKTVNTDMAELARLMRANNEYARRQLSGIESLQGNLLRSVG